ncbi:hypothetical protein EV363DRAFT_1423514 [Boletus edulis]|nr:hypothetical protein EV363DRAFT_1423514 [Boletus edulis]
MSSDVQSTLQLLVLNNCLALAGITAVVYDYVLTFSREVSSLLYFRFMLIMYKVEFVWGRPWSWVSTMFVVVRYIGLYWIVTAALSMFLGPRKVYLLSQYICINEVPKSSASPLYFCPWDSGDPDMGPLCISCEIGREMWEGLREGKTPGMSESIVGAEGKAMTWMDRQCGKGLL